MPRRPDPRQAQVAWPAGPTSPAVAEILRGLELKVNRRLDGILHGNYQGLTPGHGSEPGESRLYFPGDDVRRPDHWRNAAEESARTRPDGASGTGG